VPGDVAEIDKQAVNERGSWYRRHLPVPTRAATASAGDSAKSDPVHGTDLRRTGSDED